MVFGWISSWFTPKETIDIPQNDSANAETRKNKVKEGQSRYEWRYDAIGDAAMIKTLPIPEELPQIGWVAAIAPVLLRVVLNSAGNSLDSAAETSITARVGQLITTTTGKILTGQLSPTDITGVLREFGALAQGTDTGNGSTLQEYKEQFRVIPLDTVAKLDQFLKDDVFGWYRVAGPNPMRITKLLGAAADMFPELTDVILRGIPNFENDTLHEAMVQNRLYFVDYKELDGVPTGFINGKKKDSYNYAPRCLLAVPKQDTERLTILPIAIACGQDDSFPMYTANPKHTNTITWIAAKYTIQASDAVLHETLYHLGRCHLLMEVFNCSMHRSLPPTHPLQRLLKPSFYGTALINNAAVGSLVNDGGTVDVITAPDIGTTRQLSASSITDPSFNFNNWMPDVELKGRGVMDEVLEYPYRDDCLAMWGVINNFVQKYVDRFYKSDADVQGDYELANFCSEIVNNGKLHGFGDSPDGKIYTKPYLVRMLSMVLFTASVQHAAVNFSQSTMMQYTPAMPLGAYDEPPKTKVPYASLNEWVEKMVPDFHRSEEQIQTSETIGVMRYTQIGEYGNDFHFAGDDVKLALTQFQEELGEIGARIQARNKKEREVQLPEYNYLIPKNIPISINI